MDTNTDLSYSVPLLTCASRFGVTLSTSGHL